MVTVRPTSPSRKIEPIIVTNQGNPYIIDARARTPPKMETVSYSEPRSQNESSKIIYSEKSNQNTNKVGMPSFYKTSFVN
jgi:hypothetical protein